MKKIYKGCTIEATREKSLGGDTLLYYSVFSDTGYEITSGFEDSDETVANMIEYMKRTVDDYLENPDDY